MKRILFYFILILQGLKIFNLFLLLQLLFYEFTLDSNLSFLNEYNSNNNKYYIV